MDITPIIPEDRQIIQSYREGGFRVSGEAWHGSILVAPQRTVDWSVTDSAELAEDSLTALAALAPKTEVLLLGCGPRMVLVSPRLRRAWRDRHGFVVEVMETGAACRTYNVLLAEERRIAAALIAL